MNDFLSAWPFASLLTEVGGLELATVTTYRVEARCGDRCERVGCCDTAERAEEWAASVRSAMAGWSVHVVPQRSRRWISPFDVETPASRGR